MGNTQPSSQAVRASIWFLKEKDLYATVKPYALAFTPDSQIPRENIEREEVPTTISDMRSSTTRFTLDLNGFMIVQLSDEHPEVEWKREENVKTKHYPRVIADIEQSIPGCRCIPLTHNLRMRDPSFPESIGQDYDYGQPLRAAHVDMTRSSAEQLIQERLRDFSPEILKRRYMIANLWHPLKGPNQDWPLALCDASCVDPQLDLEIADYVTPTSSREHCMVYARESHKWWYMSHQRTTEAFLFRQHDSTKAAVSGIPHAAFLNPYSDQIEPRESIEVTVLITWEEQ